MAHKWKLFLTVIAVGLVAGLGLRVTAVSPAAQAAPLAQTSAARQITVVGQGTASAQPDLARASIGVQVTAPTVAVASQESSAKMAAVLAGLKELGVAETDIQTSNFDISLQRNVGPNGSGEITGYQVSNTVVVTMRDLSKVGQILDRAIQAGANDVFNINFGFAEPAKLQLAALDQAMADAQNRADELARSSGVQRGEVLSISEVLSANPAPLAGFAAQADRAAVPIQPGSSQVQAQVQVTYAIR